MTKIGLEEGRRRERRSARDVLPDAGAPEMPIKKVGLLRRGLRVSLGLMFEVESELDNSASGSFSFAFSVVSVAVPKAVFNDISDGAVNGISDGAVVGIADVVGYIVSEAALEAGCDGIPAAMRTPLPHASDGFRD